MTRGARAGALGRGRDGGLCVGPFRGSDGVTTEGVVGVMTCAVNDGNDGAPWGHVAYLSIVGEVDGLLEVVSFDGQFFPYAPPGVILPDGATSIAAETLSQWSLSRTRDIWENGGLQ